MRAPPHHRQGEWLFRAGLCAVVDEKEDGMTAVPVSMPSTRSSIYESTYLSRTGLCPVSIANTDESGYAAAHTRMARSAQPGRSM